MRLLHRAARLTAGEWRLVAEGACLSLATAVGVRVVTPAHVARWLAGSGSSSSVPLRVPPERAAALVAFASSFVPGSTCLTRALALSRVLARRGIGARVVIGTRRAASGIEAHAWVTSGGRVILGGAAHETYAEIARFDARPPEVAA